MLADLFEQFDHTVSNLIGQVLDTGTREPHRFDLFGNVDGVYFIAERNGENTWR